MLSIMRRFASSDRLVKMRELLRARNLEAYIIPSTDEHFSEYLALADRRCEFMSGFTGSYCTEVVTLDKAALWTDGRYFLQASRQVDENWTIMRKGIPGTPDEATWLTQCTSPGAKIGYDPRLFTASQFCAYLNKLTEAEAAEELRNDNKETSCTVKRQLVDVSDQNLVDLVWSSIASSNRPLRPANPITIVPTTFTGLTWKQKLDAVRNLMRDNGASLLVVSALDDIAWLLNLRGSDIPHCPLFFSYLLIPLEGELHLFANRRSVEPFCSQLSQHFVDADTKIHIVAYEDFYKYFKNTILGLSSERSRIWLDYSANQAIVAVVPESRCLIAGSPIAQLKVKKTTQELDGIREAHIEDSLTLCDFLAWLDDLTTSKKSTAETVAADGSSHPSTLKGDICEPAGMPPLEPPVQLTELSAAIYLDSLRAQTKTFVSLSFETISAADANGAIIHYKPVANQDAPLTSSTLYLIDSGAQYLTGTTDVTRTVHLGQPSDKQRTDYTLVLKSHIALSRQKFPSNTPGSRLDVVARHVMWQHKRNYEHGTGHGVGAFLNVHEGPIGMSGSRFIDLAQLGIAEPGICENMVVTIEPGYYEEDHYGIRLENVVFVISSDEQSNTGDSNWLTFEPVTLVPFHRDLIQTSSLNQDELKWLDAYHYMVRTKLQLRIMDENGQSVNSWDPEKLPQTRRRCWEWIQRQTAAFLQ